MQRIAFFLVVAAAAACVTTSLVRASGQADQAASPITGSPFLPDTATGS
jgi:hypothetical protein